MGASSERVGGQPIQDSVYSWMDEKPLQFEASALADLRDFPEGARRRAGFELHQVQQGRLPSDWKPIASVGPGVLEIRIHTGTEHRTRHTEAAAGRKENS